MDILNASGGDGSAAPAVDPAPAAPAAPNAPDAIESLHAEAANPPASPQPDSQPEPGLEPDPEPGANEGQEPDPQPELEPDLPAVPAPSSWKAEEQEAFRSLPRPVQETIQRREAEREQFVQRKASEAQQARQQLEVQAREEVTQIHTQAEQALLQFLGGQQPRRPDPALLRGTEEDRADYYAQQAEYEAHGAQREEAQRMAAYHRQQREQQEQVLATRDAEQQRAILQEHYPEYLDPANTPNLSRELSAIATGVLRYSPERLVQADATDIIALREVATLKAKADKYDGIQREKMARVREAKQLTPVARPGNAGAAPKPATDPLRELYPND